MSTVRSTMERILFVTGASGAGKTALVDALERRALPGVSCWHFDSMGVPPGAGEAWQREATERWVDRLRVEPGRLAVLDAQVRPSEALAAARRAAVPAAALLIDCTAELRADRLRGPRAQPELATERMFRWAAYLRGQADALQLPVIENNALLEEATELLARHVRALTV
jgi:ribose 1,5-bisphosphokinase PhnN